MEQSDNIKFKLPNQTGFKVPDGYFDSLHDKVKNRIENRELPQVSKTIQLRPYLAIAASFLLIFMAWFIVLKLNPFENKSVTAQNLESDYYDLVLESVDEELLIDVLMADNYAEDSDFAEFGDNELIDYIYDDIDMNSLYEE